MDLNGERWNSEGLEWYPRPKLLFCEYWSEVKGFNHTLVNS